MTILEYTADDSVLDIINESISQLQAAGSEPKYIVMGTDAYERFRHAMAERFHRRPKYFELYNFIPIVLDPFRSDSVTVLPGPGEVAKGVQAFRIED